MKNVIVASFKEEAKAIEALHKLSELDSFGDISIYYQIMVRKNEDGKLQILKQNDTEGWRTLTGMGVGSLLGLLGHPVGFVIGLYTGTVVGALADASHYNFANDFISNVEDKIEVGHTTIIAEIEEDSEVFIDNTLLPLGAVISRSDVDVEFDKYVDKQINQIEAEIAEQRAALNLAVGNEKQKIQDKITELQDKRRSTFAELMTKRKQVEGELKGKTLSGIAKVKADIKEFGNNISEEMKKEQLQRIKRKIEGHEETLNELKMKLKELQA